jgi:hypothetical protein
MAPSSILRPIPGWSNSEIEDFAPGWDKAFPQLAESVGRSSDKAGAALAKAWIGRI